VRVEITLYTEQTAIVIAEADPGATDDELTRLALTRLDESGGAEWRAEVGWIERRRVLDIPAPA